MNAVWPSRPTEQGKVVAGDSRRHGRSWTSGAKRWLRTNNWISTTLYCRYIGYKG